MNLIKTSYKQLEMLWITLISQELAEFANKLNSEIANKSTCENMSP